jgi:hypothetical protein
MGGMLGLFLHSAPSAQDTTNQTVRQVFREMGKTTYRQAKTFSKVGALFSCTECVIEGVVTK